MLIGCVQEYSGPKTTVTGMCRSCKPYFVRGSWHHPQTYYEYKEEGLASWYGPRFHDKKKASCERFDQHALNAAHKTLPLPTIVKVTNLENGKTIEVLVDDRGPFVYEGRIIDLSMGAAKAIGCYKNGLAKVRVESMVSESKALADYLSKHNIGKEHLKRTWLQIYEQEIKGNYLGKREVIVDEPHLERPQKKKKQQASVYSIAVKKEQKTYVINAKEDFLDKKSAERFAKKVQTKLPARVVSVKKKDGKPTWNVQAGPFTDESKIDAVRKQIKQLVK